MRNTLNETACAALLKNVVWIDATALAKLTILLLIDVMVIVGNCLVIAAVMCSSKLQVAVTNIFIASLAVADLMVGMAVLPFSSVWEVFKVSCIKIEKYSPGITVTTLSCCEASCMSINFPKWNKKSQDFHVNYLADTIKSTLPLLVN